MYRFLWILCWPFIKIFYPTRIIGKKNVIKKESAILICNHYSNNDILIVGVATSRKMHFLAKKELFKNRFIAWFMRKMGVIKVDRSIADLEAIKNSLKVLKNKELLTIFPEGTRNKEGDQLQGVKNGVCMLAIKSKCKIIPVNILRKAKFLKRNRILIGEPFELNKFYDQRLTSEILDNAGQIVYNKMKNLEIENKNYKKNKK